MEGYENNQKSNGTRLYSRYRYVSNLKNQSNKIFTNCEKILINQPQHMKNTVFSLKDSMYKHTHDTHRIDISQNPCRDTISHMYLPHLSTFENSKCNKTSIRNSEFDWIESLIIQNSGCSHLNNTNNEINTHCNENTFRYDNCFNWNNSLQINERIQEDLLMNLIASQVETPPSVISDDFKYDLCKEPVCSVDIDTFMNSKDCNSMIITAIIFKLINTNNTSYWIKYFEGFVCFIPKILMLGYVFLMRLVNRIRLDSIKEVVDSYFVCCMIANKSLKDRYSKITDMKIENINLLEGFILNELEYDINITTNEVKSTIIDIRAVDMLIKFNLNIFKR